MCTCRNCSLSCTCSCHSRSFAAPITPAAKRDWKPGDVALVPGVGRCMWTERGWATPRGKIVGNFLDPKALVTIDPDDPEQVERLAAAWEGVERCDLDNVLPMTMRQLRMRAALHSLIEPPKPAKVFEHMALDGGRSRRRALCGKVWEPTENVTVLGRCPECVELVQSGWVA